MKPTLIDVNEIDKHDADDVNQLLVRNKCDFASKKVVSTGETRVLADYLNIRLLEASAKSAHSVEQALSMSQVGNYRSSFTANAGSHRSVQTAAERCARRY